MGNVTEIITKEKINQKLVEDMLPEKMRSQSSMDQAEIARAVIDIYARSVGEQQVVWHQEVHGKIIPKTRGSSPVDTTPCAATVQHCR